MSVTVLSELTVWSRLSTYVYLNLLFFVLIVFLDVKKQFQFQDLLLTCMSESFSVVPWPQQRSPAAIGKQNAAGGLFNLNDHYFHKKYSTMHTKNKFLIKNLFLTLNAKICEFRNSCREDDASWRGKGYQRVSFERTPDRIGIILVLYETFFYADSNDTIFDSFSPQ